VWGFLVQIQADLKKLKLTLLGSDELQGLTKPVILELGFGSLQVQLDLVELETLGVIKHNQGSYLHKMPKSQFVESRLLSA